MKKFFALSLVAMLVMPAFAATTRTTTTETYQDPTVLEEDLIESEEYNDGVDEVEIQKMEVVEKDEIDYSDRTRTNRERKALHTGSHASDDH